MDSLASTQERGAYDAVILGTSPVLLIEGLLRARAGARLLFLDAQECIGGAWLTTELDEITQIESACHLMENYRGAYEFLERVVGVPLEICRPAPLVVQPGGRVCLYCSRWRNFRRLMRVGVRFPVVAVIRVLEAMSGGRLRVRRTSGFGLREAVRKIGTLLLHPYWPRAERVAIRYPVGGAPRMIERLLSELRSLGAEFVRQGAEKLVLSNVDDSLVELGDGRVFVGRQFVISESTVVRTVVVDGAATDFEQRRCVYPHAIVEVSGLARRECSYVHFQDDPFVGRVSDVTEYCSNVSVDSGHRILVIQFRGRPIDDDAELVSTALSHLVSYGVFPDGVRARRHRVIELEMSESAPSVAKWMGQAGRPDTVVLSSLGDLSRTILYNRRRWLGLARIRSDRPRNTSPEAERASGAPCAAAPVVVEHAHGE